MALLIVLAVFAVLYTAIQYRVSIESRKKQFVMKLFTEVYIEIAVADYKVRAHLIGEIKSIYKKSLQIYVFMDENKDYFDELEVDLYQRTTKDICDDCRMINENKSEGFRNFIFNDLETILNIQ